MQQSTLVDPNIPPARAADTSAAQRALALVRFVASRHGPVAASTIIRSCGYPRSTTYVLLRELEQGGWLRCLPDRRWTVGATARAMAREMRHQHLDTVAAPALRDLSVHGRLGASLWRIDGRDVVCQHHEHCHRHPPLHHRDERIPVVTSTPGIALLAALPDAELATWAALLRRTGDEAVARLREAREHGGALTIDHTQRVIEAAYAILDVEGRPIAALAAATAAPTGVAPDGFVDHVRHAAASVARQLGAPELTLREPELRHAVGT